MGDNREADDGQFGGDVLNKLGPDNRNGCEGKDGGEENSEIGKDMIV